MRIWFIAVLTACLVLPVGAESPFDRLSEEESKAIAKEIAKKFIDEAREIVRNDPTFPSEGEEIDECNVNAWLGTGFAANPKYFSKRTDHLKPCPPMWKVLGGEESSAWRQFIVAYGYPFGNMGLKCNEVRPGAKELRLYFYFRDHWLHGRDLGPRLVRRKKDRVHLHLGIWSQVEAAEEGEGFTLRQTTIDYDWPHRSWARTRFYSGEGKRRRRYREENTHEAPFFGEEAAALIRKIYHSEAISWTNLKTGETNTVLTGEVAQPSIAKLMNYCGFNLTEAETSSPSQASQR